MDKSIFGPIVESIAWYTCGLEPPDETLFPVMRTPTTMALLNPPGTTEDGTLVHETVWEVEVGFTLANAFPEPAFFDLYVSPLVSHAIQQL